MNEQKNLFLAIGLSVVIIIAFQFLFPQQPMITPTSEQIEEKIEEKVEEVTEQIEQKVETVLPWWLKLLKRIFG